MITTVNKKISMDKDLLSRIKWACTFSNCVPKIKNGNLRMIEKTNLAYIEPHSVIIKEKLYLFFNNHDFFYVGNLSNKFLLSRLKDVIGNN